jgi:hypothetical protein
MGKRFVDRLKAGEILIADGATARITGPQRWFARRPRRAPLSLWQVRWGRPACGYGFF